ncbi:MAG: PucR family transcriptional regulator ligand-binding domain-containing protein [Blautia sp.]
MSVTLRELYNTTRHRYGLTLYTKNTGLDKPVNWIYVSEDINTFDFLKEGDLVITTGVSAGTDQKAWLSDYIHMLIRHETCGLIINTGNYIKEAHISDSVISLCNANNFPLFTMPWEVSIHDITRDYYQRLFLDSQSSERVTNAFLSLLTNSPDSGEQTGILDKMGFPVKDSCCVCVCDWSFCSSRTAASFMHQLESAVQDTGQRFHTTEYGEKILLICCRPSMCRLRESLKTFALHNGCPVGIGSLVSDFSGLSSSLRLADISLLLGLHRGESVCSYQEIGFFQILMNVSDTQILRTYTDRKLKTLEDYDQLHNTAYLETLRQYLLCNGSIQAIAASMHCHRNTINYRVHILKEMLNENLDDMQIRYEYMTAFYIREYLEL